MHESGEYPILPPESETPGHRFESADIDIDALREFIGDTKFESQAELESLLSQKYHMLEKDSIGHIEVGMTREWNFDEIIDTFDPKRLLPRSREDFKEYRHKIVEALTHNADHITLRNYAFFLTDKVKEALERAVKGRPLSGRDPQAVLRMSIPTLDEQELDLRIFRVYNRNDHFRYEYVIKPASHA